MEQKQFTQIKDFKRVQYLPRLGKIRLGVKAVSKKTGKEYPKEVDYFVCPPEVRYYETKERDPDGQFTGQIIKVPIYGDKPKLLDIMFPSDDPAQVIPYCYKSYGANNRLKCKGDGETAIWFNPETKEMEERKCPCEALEKRECDKRGHLMVILPKVSLGGVYQIDTGSGVNINRILDAIGYWKEMVGRCKLLPLTLERVPEKVGNPENGTMQTHYLLKFGTNLNIDLLNQAIENNRKILTLDYKVEKPIEEGKLDDTPIEIIENGEIVGEEEKGGELAKAGGIEDILADKEPKTKAEPEKGKKYLCENCGDGVSVAEAGYSKKNCDGKTLCFKCQGEYVKAKSKTKVRK